MPIKLSIERQTFSFDCQVIEIGSSPSNQIVLANDARVALRHAVLRSVNGRWIIEAKDGGLLRIGNGRPTSFGWVNPGDLIRLTETGPDLVFGSDSQPVAAMNSPVQASPVKPKPVPSEAIISPPVGQKLDETRFKRAPGNSGDAPPKIARPGLPWIGPVSGAILMILVITCFAVMNSKWGKDPPMPDPSPLPSPVPTPSPVPIPVVQKTLQPENLLVLIGIGELQGEVPPQVLSVGWLYDSRTVIISRYVAAQLEEFETQAKNAGHPARGCVIQGVPMEIGNIEHLRESNEISILRLKTAVATEAGAAKIWRTVGGAEINRQLQLGQKLTYCSFQKFTKSKFVQGKHGFSLCDYDPNVCQIDRGVAVTTSDRDKHLIDVLSPAAKFEGGGILTDHDGQIVGTVINDGTIVWTNSLEKLLATRSK